LESCVGDAKDRSRACLNSLNPRDKPPGEVGGSFTFVADATALLADASLATAAVATDARPVSLVAETPCENRRALTFVETLPTDPPPKACAVDCVDWESSNPVTVGDSTGEGEARPAPPSDRRLRPLPLCVRDDPGVPPNDPVSEGDDDNTWNPRADWGTPDCDGVRAPPERAHIALASVTPGEVPSIIPAHERSALVWF
jgi:hypothetical protein